MISPFRLSLPASMLLGLVTACHHSPAISPCHCREAGNAVRTLADVTATVGADSQTRNYALFIPRATASSPVEIGILCDSLPGSLSQVGKRVVFSGTYYAKSGGATADTIRYFLTYSQVAAQ